MSIELVASGLHLLAEQSTTAATQAEESAGERIIFGWIVVHTLLSAALMRRLGCFRIHSMAGPLPQGIDRRAGSLLLALYVGILVVLIAGALMLRRLGPSNTNESLAAAFANLLAIPAIVSIASRATDQGLRELGVHRSQFPRAILYGAAGWFIAYPWVAWAGNLSDVIVHHYSPDANTKHAFFNLWGDASTLWRVITVISVLSITPILEELLFRGLLQSLGRWMMIRVLPARPTAARWGAVFISALLFTLVHRPVAIELPIFVLAIGLGYLYERTGNLWACMIMHALFNAFQLLVWRLAL